MTASTPFIVHILSSRQHLMPQMWQKFVDHVVDTAYNKTCTAEADSEVKHQMMSQHMLKALLPGFLQAFCMNFDILYGPCVAVLHVWILHSRG